MEKRGMFSFFSSFLGILGELFGCFLVRFWVCWVLAVGEFWLLFW